MNQQPLWTEDFGLPRQEFRNLLYALWSRPQRRRVRLPNQAHMLCYTNVRAVAPKMGGHAEPSGGCPHLELQVQARAVPARF